MPARDPERAAAFYRRVFDWTIERLDWAGGDYYRIAVPTGDAAGEGGGLPGIPGGLLRIGDVDFQQPLVVIHLLDETVAECAAKIELAGGWLESSPRSVGEMGEFATFRDPEGNLLGLWRSLKGVESSP